MLDVTLRTFFTFAASALAASSSATLSTIGIVNGSVWIGLFHSPTWLPGVGASTTGMQLARAVGLGLHDRGPGDAARRRPW